MTDGGKPLPSAADVSEPLAEEETPEPEVEAEAASPEPEEKPAARPARPPPPPFKVSTFLYVFLGLLGLWMLIDGSARSSIAGLFGTSPGSPGPLYSLIGFNSDYLLLTMALAGAIEMLITSVAYNFTTNWVKAAKVQKWSAAFRKVQMEAIRSGKKDRIAALKPQQEKLTRLSGEVSIAQFKGMAITYFLLILIYSWVYLVIEAANPVQRTVSFGSGASIVLTSNIGGLPIPIWFVIFSLYTVPFSLVFRRLLKHLWLRKYANEHNLTPAAPASETAGGRA
ncbi:MAG: EMC3/TMCO1 family protein [Thermoplasmata archaeon]